MAIITMNFWADFAALCAAELNQVGISPPSSPQDAIRAYLNVKHRRVARTPRTVHKANYIVPSELEFGERALINAASLGHDLQPYQSTRIDSINFKDLMLNDFGIQHFHLGIEPYAQNPKFQDRTGPLLFAIIKPNDFYAIGIFSHGAWSQSSLLDIVHDTWPEILAPYVMKGAVALERNITDEERERLRQGNINTPSQRPDGTIHFSPGLGFTTNRNPLLVSLQEDELRRAIDDAEMSARKAIIKALSDTTLSAPVFCRLLHRGSDAYAEINGGFMEIYLGQGLKPQPL